LVNLECFVPSFKSTFEKGHVVRHCCDITRYKAKCIGYLYFLNQSPKFSVQGQYISISQYFSNVSVEILFTNG